MTPEELDEARKVAGGLFAVTDSIVEFYEREAIKTYSKLIRYIDELERENTDQAAEIKRLEAALVEERKGLECAGCGKRYEDVRGKSGKDGDLLLGEIRLDPGSPANHVEPEISYEIYFWCVECGRMHDR